MAWTVSGVEPDRGTDAGLSNGCEIGAGNDVVECERDRLRLEDDDVRRSGLRADEAEVLLVERWEASRSRAERADVGADGGHEDAPSFRVSFLTWSIYAEAEMSRDGAGVDLEPSGYCATG